MAKIARREGTFSDVFEREASPVEGQLREQKDKKRRKERQKKN